MMFMTEIQSNSDFVEIKATSLDPGTLGQMLTEEITMKMFAR